MVLVRPTCSAKICCTSAYAHHLAAVVAGAQSRQLVRQPHPQVEQVDRTSKMSCCVGGTIGLTPLAIAADSRSIGVQLGDDNPNSITCTEIRTAKWFGQTRGQNWPS